MVQSPELSFAAVSIQVLKQYAPPVRADVGPIASMSAAQALPARLLSPMPFRQTNPSSIKPDPNFQASTLRPHLSPTSAFSDGVPQSRKPRRPDALKTHSMFDNLQKGPDLISTRMKENSQRLDTHTNGLPCWAPAKLR